MQAVKDKALEQQLAASVEYNEKGTVSLGGDVVPLHGKQLEQFVVHGDLSVLNPAAKVQHYIYVCQSVGLNPATKPFEYIKLNGKEVLYARRDATDQLRKLHRVKIDIVCRERIEDLFCVTARATTADGRQDESIGAVSIANLRGEMLANAMMKAETKAKRRVTLSICGLGFFDESELDGVDHADPRFAAIPAEEAPQPPQQQAPAPVIVEAKQEKKAATLPPLPDGRIEVIPVELANGIKPIAEFAGLQLARLALEDLEFLGDELRKAYDRVKTADGRRWIQALGAEVEIRLQSFTPMPDEPPAE
jgi:hypothetical protein